jgi:hypothetical protein
MKVSSQYNVCPGRYLNPGPQECCPLDSDFRFGVVCNIIIIIIIDCDGPQ